MKPLFLLLSLSLSPSVFADNWANATLYNVTSGTNGGGGGSTNSALFSENFEGWTNWSVPGGSPWTLTVNDGWLMDWTLTSFPASEIKNESTAGLSMQGTNCLELVDMTDDYPAAFSPVFAAQSECWVYFEWRSALLGSSVLKTAALLDSNGSDVSSIQIVNSGLVDIRNGTNILNVSSVVTNNITYSLYWHYIQGTGANGYASLGITNNPVRPTSGSGFAEATAGNSTNSAVQLRLSVDGVGDQYFDKIRVYSGSTPPADNPQ